jgi:translation initiation factor 2 alpha subunit (eIF-2alpha)
MEKLESGDIVLCTVDRIVGTMVFVKIKGNGEGSIVLSEVAPGRIRNLRDYVVPKKRIVCKVLRISGERIELSLRRVNQKERKEILEQDKKEKSYKVILKKILGEKSIKIIDEIEKENNLYNFLEEAKNDKKELDKIIGEKDSEKILNILKTQKKKIKKIKREIFLTTIKPNGIDLIKKICEIFKGITIKYISAGRYSLETETEDIKSTDKNIQNMMEIAEKTAKKLGMEFSVKENKNLKNK